MIVNLLYILLAIVILGVLVMVHEFGHYIVGRLTGMTVLEFSIGFGPKLLGWRRKGIDYSLRLIPLGGYCSFLGEDENNDDPRAMNNQPVWRRFLTVLAGPLMNFVFAFLICVVSMMLYEGVRSLPQIQEVAAGSPAAEAGIAPGDTIVAVNGREITDGNSLTLSLSIATADDGEAVDITVLRDGGRQTLSMVPRAVEQEDGTTIKQIGIVYVTQVVERYSLGTALQAAPRRLVEIVEAMVDALKGLVFHGEGATEVAGPVGIVGMISEGTRTGGFYMVLYLMYIFSLNLGLMNLLPLPALDGGRLVFLIVEAIRRKPVPPEKEGMVHGIGMLLLLGLIVVITWQDIARLIVG